jgi:nitrogen fixation protein FixH
MSPTQLTALRPDTRGTLTGWHVLALLVAFFGTMFIANGFLIYYALGTFSGTVTDSSYQASQAYNLYIAAARAQQLRNWHVTTEAKRFADGHVAIRVVARDADNVPIDTTDFVATLQRPTTRSQDRPVPLTANLDEPGVYVGTVADVSLGQWSLVIAADTDTTPANDAARVRSHDPKEYVPHLFESETRVIFK